MGLQPQPLRDDLVQPASNASAGILTRVTTATQIPALKEWAVIVHALLEGEQIVDVRKGGLREDGRHFQVAAPRFYLYPTTEHQKPELLKPAYRRWIDLVTAAPVGQPLTVPGWAEVVESVTITEPEPLAALEGKAHLVTRLRRDPAEVEAATRSGCWCCAPTASTSRSRSRGTTPTAVARRGSTSRASRRSGRAAVDAGAHRRRVRGPQEGRRRGARPYRLPPRTTADGAVGAVAAVAGLGEGVGAEGGELLRREELVDRRGDLVVGVGEIEVVDDLACACRRGTGSARSGSAGSSRLAGNAPEPREVRQPERPRHPAGEQACDRKEQVSVQPPNRRPASPVRSECRALRPSKHATVKTLGGRHHDVPRARIRFNSLHD